MNEVTELMVKNCAEIPEFRFVPQPVNDFLFRSAENPIAMDEDEEGFSETMPQNTPPKQLPALGSIKDLHNSSTARQLLVR